ncbi:RNA polymerase, sigma-24 subunit, ECF subfamily [Fulvivirga imtechensis AK7]|uniref:RNA polymerase, sigma-24 subunit, ECF subfamily n=1 Tax=Fulvivirga imtechensis AK7 TaxID=1237149 RepID=L8JLM7_9BACT|nr:sigma-70 family RNA polymerase sigma factor [Fulvivirga imtechensis]ELR69148.1 RNA polymerase, sigma-24 subunit, ECF subfamily [Fulvivirga imtechensis AK7]
MKESEPHEDQRYIDALLNNDSVLVREIYEKWSAKVVAYIKKNNGDESQARDVIQETLLVIYRQAYEKGLVLTCPFEAYFFLLCKRRWLNYLKENHRKEVTIDDELTSLDIAAEQVADSTERYELKSKIIEEQLNAISEKCREIIKLTLEIKSLQTVAEKLGVTYAYLRKKKSLCMGRLTELVRGSNAFKNLNDQ